MNLYESIKNSSTKLTESVNGFIHIVWGPEASEDNLDDNERWELVGLVNAIEDAEDDYNDGKLDLESFINLIKEECKAHGLSDEETKTAADFYEKSYKGEEQEDDEESFIMHNENSDKDVRVWKQDGKWYDEEGNRYMGYLSKQDVKNYFKGNWHEVKESDDIEKNKDFQSKAKALALDSENDYTTSNVKLDYVTKYLKNGFNEKLTNELGNLVRVSIEKYNRSRLCKIDFNTTYHTVNYIIGIDQGKDKDTEYQNNYYEVTLNEGYSGPILLSSKIPTRDGSVDNMLNSFIDNAYSKMITVINAFKYYSLVVQKFEKFFDQNIETIFVSGNPIDTGVPEKSIGRTTYKLISGKSVDFIIKFNGININEYSIENPKDDNELNTVFTKIKNECLPAEQTSLDLDNNEDIDRYVTSESEDKVEVKTVKDNNGTFFTIYKTKEGKYVDANNRPLDDEDLKQFGLKEEELRHKKGYCYNCGAKLDPKDTYVINGNYYCGACKGDAEQRQLDDEIAYKERQKDLTNNFNDTYEESDLKENVGDKNDYSDKIKALATKFCKQHYGRLSTYFKGIEIESKTTPTAIKYKLTLDVFTNLSRVYDDVQELADFISGHIPAVKFVKSDTYNMTGSDLNEDLNLYFIQNTEFKDVGGDNVMEDSELKEFYDNPEPVDDSIEVSGSITVTYNFTNNIPKNWNYDDLIDDIKSNLSDYTDNVEDIEIDCSYEGPQDYEDRRADEQYDEERINNG